MFWPASARTLSLVNGGTTNIDTGAGVGGGNLSLTLNNAAIVNLTTTQYIKTITLNSSSKLNMAAGLFKVLLTDSISVPGTTAKLDLGDNDFIIHNSDAAVLTALLQRGRGSASAPWTGSGITSSTAAADSTHLTAIGAVRNNQFQVVQTNFDGQPVTGTDVLIKFTYTGDATLNGTTDANDYFQVDHGFTQRLTGWFNGDFDYSGTVDFNDYCFRLIRLMRR